MQAAKAYFDARREAIQACIKAQEEDYRLRALPDRNLNDGQHQAEERSEELRALQHRGELGRLTRDREHAETEAVRVAARQALDAQRDLGTELVWKKRRVDLLDVELAIAERRAILRQHFDELDRAMRGINPGAGNSAAVENALYEARAVERPRARHERPRCSPRTAEQALAQSGCGQSASGPERRAAICGRRWQCSIRHCFRGSRRCRRSTERPLSLAETNAGCPCSSANVHGESTAT
jgi:hypothetical protein